MAVFFIPLFFQKERNTIHTPCGGLTFTLSIHIRMSEDRLYLIALSMSKGLGPVLIRNLVAFCGSVKKVLETPRGKLGKVPGIGEKTIDAILKARTLLPFAEQEIKRSEKYNVELLCYLDKAYPQHLKFIHDAPIILYKKGNIDFNAQPSIALVGTRTPTEYGKKMTALFADFFAKQGVNIVSGLAYGIDMTAHKTVLAENGITTAVLAHGLDTIYPPTHQEKAVEMLEKGGWLSEYAFGTKPDTAHFPARNRIVSGMSKAIIVIEAAEKGGALITARSGFEQNREVYALPGNVGNLFSEGCNKLIRENIAKLVTHPQEVLEDLEIQWLEYKAKVSESPDAIMPFPNIPLSADETLVLNLLRNSELQIDNIAIQAGLPIATINSLLLMMEFKGLVAVMPGKKYRLQ